MVTCYLYIEAGFGFVTISRLKYKTSKLLRLINVAFCYKIIYFDLEE
jgi:hypothetical protein